MIVADAAGDPVVVITAAAAGGSVVVAAACVGALLFLRRGCTWTFFPLFRGSPPLFGLFSPALLIVFGLDLTWALGLRFFGDGGGRCVFCWCGP